MSSTDAERNPAATPEQDTEHTSEAPAAPVVGRSIVSIASDLLRPKPRTGGAPSKALVNGLERREIVMAGVTLLFNLYLVLAYWRLLHDSTTKIDRADAPDFLIAGLIGIGLVLVGITFRRRALLGFAIFLVGLVFITYHLVVGFVLNAGIGAWLLFRVSQRQKARAATRTVAPDRATRTGGSTRSARSSSKRAPAGPAPSKRYTPPRRKPGSPKR